MVRMVTYTNEHMLLAPVKQPRPAPHRQQPVPRDIGRHDAAVGVEHQQRIAQHIVQGEQVGGVDGRSQGHDGNDGRYMAP